ncbi:MAG: toxin-antitoxin system HicB family antitoxin [Hyphomicrobiales bacterium]|nr:toxin-antitoxin system HicB family antitoxin [Hyphomicrobiales bacterium]
MSSKVSTFPLRLPRSLKTAVEQIAREDGTSVNQFVVTALAEKISALKTAEIFAERKQRADFEAFDRIMNRRSGQTPATEDSV